jgi:acyl-[acyl-carrier-protein]-phospholipid O-acyltransferase/long-chain-fatty-acid--[acyl-carrier-protein] ligase
MLSSLLKTRRFAPIFWCQLLSALNDNLVKNALVMLILFHIAKTWQEPLVALAGAFLVAPFFFLSGYGGELADRYDKAIIARNLKLAEIPVAILAAIGLLLHSIPVLFAALACYGIIAALFGPIKYGILPFHLETRELPAGNALIEGATFFAILIGTIAGNYVAADPLAATIIAGAVVTLGVATWLSARQIPETGEAAPDLVINDNPLVSTFALIADIRRERRIWIGALITSWFWLVGAVMLILLPSLLKTAVGGTEGVVSLGLVVFTVGVALGSGLAALASKTRPNLALVPIGALFMGLFCLDLSLVALRLPSPQGTTTATEFLASVTGMRILVDLGGLAAAGGLFIVPSFAAVQAWAPFAHRARIVAGCNVLGAAFMTAASLGLAVLGVLGVGLVPVLAVLALANVAVMVLVLRAWGADGIRDVAHFLFKLAYGLEVKGLENLPQPGERAILAPNHVSLLDAPMLHAVLPSRSTFAIDTGMANTWWVKPFLKLVDAHPIDPTRPLGARSLINAVKAGEPLIIFPEGRVTVSGGLMKVYDGTAMVADKADAKVYPVRIDGPERSPFGYMRAGETRKSWFPRCTITILPPVKLEIDPALRGKARRQAAGAALQDVMVNAAVSTANIDQTLFSALAEAKATRDTGKPAVQDPLGTKLSYRKLILSAQVLGRCLAPMAPQGAAVGVLLPNSAGVAVTFFALQTIGRVPAMLNFSAGAKSLLAACAAAKVELILTSRAFIEKARLDDVLAQLAAVARIVYLEDIRKEITFADKVAGMLLGTREQVIRQAGDPAAVLFTSGSEGTPKGVVLSHRNILANAVQSLTRVTANGDDKVFNVLPVFHSFGLTAGLIMPLTAGIPVYLYPTPLHYRIVPELIYGTNATILFGTDTFLNGYARAAHPYDFHNVRLILAGAEAVKDRTRQIYMEKFGVRILEGYGVTETAPVLAINTPLANKTGTVGRLSPLMEARLEPVAGIDADAPGQKVGRLLVRGPNVMLGYFRAEHPGVLEAPKDGWHDTGDIVAIDAQGFIAIKGRAKRFAKIGGEMVSLAAVEAAAADIWPAVLSVVVALPDQRKGERLVLMTTDKAATRDAFQRYARAKGLPELMLPSEIQIVPAIPLLGSGKPDMVAALALAKERAAAPNPSTAPAPAAA